MRPRRGADVVEVCSGRQSASIVNGEACQQTVKLQLVVQRRRQVGYLQGMKRPPPVIVFPRENFRGADLFLVHYGIYRIPWPGGVE